uniref:hypothetical protein n=1 Tax=Kitasatospora sp. MBT63 TaxID=1444768 RepID=UPI00053B2C5E
MRVPQGAGVLSRRPGPAARPPAGPAPTERALALRRPAAQAGRRPYFTAQLTRAAALAGADLTWHSRGWVAELRRGGRHTHVVGYEFPLNDAAAAAVAADKVATCAVLAAAGVPAVGHRLLRQGG